MSELGAAVRELRALDEKRYRLNVPLGMPVHGWPNLPDYDKYPDLVGKPPAWWQWYKLEAYEFSGQGRVVVMTGNCNTSLVREEVLSDRGPSVVRTVACGTKEACEAAYRLLSGEWS